MNFLTLYFFCYNFEYFVFLFFMLNALYFFIILFFFLILSFFFNTKNTFFLLIISELFWITLYVLVVIVAIFSNNVCVLSLSLFFLIFSAVEISTGISILMLHQSSFNNLSLNNLYLSPITKAGKILQSFMN